MLRIILALTLWAPPSKAADIAAYLVGRPDIAHPLKRVCLRESSCLALRVHRIDAGLSARSYWGHIKLGHLRRVCQTHGKQDGRWSTRGAWGLNAADHWRYMPPCYQPEMLDVPLVSAYVAARKYLRLCDGRRVQKQARWCPLGVTERDRRRAVRQAARAGQDEPRASAHTQHDRGA